MKNLVKSTLLIVLLCINYIYSQPLHYANVILDSVKLTKGNQLEFVLRLQRVNTNWDYFANATFQFAFDSIGYNVSPDRHSIELLPGSSDLPIVAIPGVLPTRTYIVTPNVLPRRFSITIAGPENYEDCVIPSTSQGIVIGKFVIKTKDGTVPPQKLRCSSHTYIIKLVRINSTGIACFYQICFLLKLTTILRWMIKCGAL